MIRRHRFSDTSLIATCYTDGYGKLRLLAKGALRGGSPSRGKLDLFMRNSILFYHGRGDLHTLKECDTVDTYRGIRESLDRIAAASYVAEMIDGLTVAENGDPPVYALLVRSLAAIAAGGKAVSVAACFALKMLGRLGNFPQYRSCLRCGAVLQGERFFDGRAFRCAGCSSGGLRVSEGTVSILDSLFARGSAGSIASPSAVQLRELAELSSRIFESERGRRMRTKLTV